MSIITGAGEKPEPATHWSGLQDGGLGPRPQPVIDMKHYYLTEDIALEISDADDEDRLFGALSKAADRMGFDHFALAYDRRGYAGPSSMLIHNYPDAWAKAYVDFDLGGADPVRRAGERAMTGFSWRDLNHYIPLTRGDRRMLAAGRQNGIGDGYTIPRHLPGEASGSCTFVVAPGSDIPGDLLNVAEVVGAVALTRARQLMGSAPPRKRAVLSERQRECVLWSARGKTAGEIGAILGIAEETVIQHLRTARDRYHVHCRQMLILCALFDGLIGFSDVYDWWRAE